MLSSFSRNGEIPNFMISWITDHVESSATPLPLQEGMSVNYARTALATLGATVAYFAYGFAMFAALPSMKNDFLKYPSVYRPRADLMKVMPYLACILIRKWPQ